MTVSLAARGNQLHQQQQQKQLQLQLASSPPVQGPEQQKNHVTMSSAVRGVQQPQKQLLLVSSSPVQRAEQQTIQMTLSPAARGNQQEQLLTLSPTDQKKHRATEHKESLSSFSKKRKSTDVDAASYLALLNVLLDEDRYPSSVDSANASNAQSRAPNLSTDWGEGTCKGIRSFTMSRNHWENLFKNRDEFVRMLQLILYLQGASLSYVADQKCESI